jgi:hypothetical protein
VEGVGNVAHSPPPGWYPAGDASGTLRWWDGRQWTNHVASPTPGTPPRRSRTRSALLISLSVLAAIAVMFGSMLLYAFASGEAHDARSLDDEDIRSTASASCSKLAGELTNRTRDRVADIRSGNVAIDALVDTMTSSIVRFSATMNRHSTGSATGSSSPQAGGLRDATRGRNRRATRDPDRRRIPDYRTNDGRCTTGVRRSHPSRCLAVDGVPGSPSRIRPDLPLGARRSAAAACACGGCDERALCAG